LGSRSTPRRRRPERRRARRRSRPTSAGRRSCASAGWAGETGPGNVRAPRRGRSAGTLAPALAALSSERSFRKLYRFRNSDRARGPNRPAASGRAPRAGAPGAPGARPGRRPGADRPGPPPARSTRDAREQFGEAQQRLARAGPDRRAAGRADQKPLPKPAGTSRSMRWNSAATAPSGGVASAPGAAPRLPGAPPVDRSPREHGCTRPRGRAARSGWRLGRAELAEQPEQIPVERLLPGALLGSEGAAHQARVDTHRGGAA